MWVENIFALILANKLDMQTTIVISGIELLEIEDPAWVLESRGLTMYGFRVIGPDGITRDDLDLMIGELLYGKLIQGIDSFAVDSQLGRSISIGVESEPSDPDHN